jgi:hypothetical protein
LYIFLTVDDEDEEREEEREGEEELGMNVSSYSLEYPRQLCEYLHACVACLTINCWHLRRLSRKSWKVRIQSVSGLSVSPSAYPCTALTPSEHRMSRVICQYRWRLSILQARRHLQNIFHLVEQGIICHRGIEVSHQSRDFVFACYLIRWSMLSV